MAAPDGKTTGSLRPTSPGSLTQLPSPKGCLKWQLKGSPCGKLGPVRNPYDVAVSPEGDWVYVVGQGTGTLTAYERSVQDGSLRFVQCVSYQATDKCTHVRGMSNIAEVVAVTPDGKTVYVGTDAPGSIVVLHAASDGTLTQSAGTAGCVGGEVADGCASMATAGTILSLAVSPDGTSLYATSPSAISVFRIRSNGNLRQLDAPDGCWVGGTGGPCSSFPDLQLAFDVVPFGNDLVAFSGYDSTGNDMLSVWKRDPATGKLTAPVADACLVADDMSASCTMTTVAIGIIARVGSHLVTDRGGQSLTLLDVSATGVLTPLSCVGLASFEPCAPGHDLGDGLSSQRMAVVGRQVYVPITTDSSAGGALVVFDVHADEITQRPDSKSCFLDSSMTQTPECTSTYELAGAFAAAASPDGRSLYVTGWLNHVLSVFKRDTALPHCADVRAQTTKGKAVTVPLHCTDRDGDPVTIKIKRPPTHATLGPVRRDGTVRLTPAPHFTGHTSFTFYAVSAAVSSAIAKAVVVVRPRQS